MDLNFFALDAFILLVVAFALVRRTATFLACGTTIAALFAVATSRALPLDRAAEWVLTVVGLVAWTAGLGIVRLMVTRSVSLRMMSAAAAGSRSTFEDDLRSRFIELQRWGLVRCTGGTNALTARGRAFALVIGAAYSAACITA